MFPEVVVIWSVAVHRGSSRPIKTRASPAWSGGGKTCRRKATWHTGELTEQGSIGSCRTEICRKYAAFILFVKLLLGVIDSQKDWVGAAGGHQVLLFEGRRSPTAINPDGGLSSVSPVTNTWWPPQAIYSDVTLASALEFFLIARKYISL